MPGSPSQAGIDLSNWNWKAVRQFVSDHFGLSLSRSSCLNYLHRLGFVLKRPQKRLVKADPVRREAFVVEYAALTASARRSGAKIFFADEAHFRADGDLRGKWVLKGEPALVDSTSPRRGEKVSYYSAVCLETGEVEVMELEGNSNSATSAAFLRQLRARHAEPLTVIWDNSPAHRGDAIRRLSDHARLEPAPGESAQPTVPIWAITLHRQARLRWRLKRTRGDGSSDQPSASGAQSRQWQEQMVGFFTRLSSRCAEAVRRRGQGNRAGQAPDG